MTQKVWYSIESIDYHRELPDPLDEVLPGVPWGDVAAIFTPAFWLSQFWMHGFDQKVSSPYKSNGSLAEEITFCLLGGFGITAELATAAFNRCNEEGLVSRLETDVDAWTQMLQQPLMVEGKRKHYRFPNQKSYFLANAMKFLQNNPLDHLKGRALRDELLKIKGVGPKTAGWVVRNIDDSDDVAILDIHLIRAGQLCGIFSKSQKVERDYAAMEERFLNFCRALGVRPAIFDCLIWDQMRILGDFALDVLRGTPAPQPQTSEQHVQYGLL